MKILILLLLTVLNGVFALSEIALVSVNKNRIRQEAKKGNARAKTVLNLLENPAGFLSSVQVGITLVSIIAGAYGGTSLRENVEPWLRQIPWLAPYADSLSLVLIIGGIMYFSIVFGELIPKSIALNNAEKISLAVAPFVRYFSLLTYPLVKLLSFSTKFVLRLLNVKPAPEDSHSEEELRQMLKTAGRLGVLKKEISEMHQNIFLFSDQRARNLKTHRTDVEWFDINDPLPEIQERMKTSAHSQFPVCQGSVDNVIGFFTSKDFLEQVQNPNFTLRQILRPPIFVSETAYAFSILKLFKKHKQYLAMIIDEYGSFEGIITLHDLTEAIVGDLPDLDETDEPEIKQREDGSHLVSGITTIHQLNAFLGQEIVKENPEDYTTLAGFLIFETNRIPKTGERFIFGNFEYEILDLDGHRIDKILMQEITPSVPTEKEQAG